MKSIMFVAAALLTSAVGANDEPWRLTTLPQESGFQWPFAHTITLSDQRPAALGPGDVSKGRARRYGAIVYGTPNSMPVTLVIDRISNTKVEIFLDTDRDQKLEASERSIIELLTEGAQRPVIYPLDVITRRDTVETRRPGRIAIWIGRDAATARYASVQFAEGTVGLGRRTITARQVDGDGNGFYDDPADLLWLDLDGDARWNCFLERFAWSPMIRVAGKRYAAHRLEDRPGISLTEMTASGAVKVRLAGIKSPERLSEVLVKLGSRDGISATINTLDTSVPLPVGDYAVFSVKLLFESSDGGKPWYFEFGPAAQSPKTWRTVRADEVLAIEPLDSLRFEAHTYRQKQPLVPGGVVSVYPRLNAGADLTLLMCCRSEKWDSQTQTNAAIRAVTADGVELVSEQPGFS